MLGFLCMVLKVIGLILAAIFALLLTLVLFALILPVSYRVWVSGDTGEPKTFAYRIRIFGIQLLPKKERKRRKTKKTSDETEQMTDLANTSGVQQANASQTQHPDQDEPGAETSQRSTSEKLEKKEKNFLKKSKKKRSGRNVRGMLERFYVELTDEGNQKALQRVILEIRYLIHHFGPRRVRADAGFSLGDPANTGYATAALSICPFTYGKNCQILPDFEADQLYFRGWLDLKGHVRMIHVLVVGIRLLSDRNIRVSMKKILKTKST